MRIKLLCLLWLYSIFASAQMINFNGSSDNFIENIHRSLPVFITAPQGGTTVDLEITTLEVFPNPAKSTLKFRANETISTISIYNILGQKLKRYTINKSSGTLNIKNLANGIYLIKFETLKDISVTKKILKN